MKVLAVGAHFDDVELGCGGAIAKHVMNGDDVILYVATKSGYANHAGKTIRSDEEAAREGRKAADILGVKRVVTGGFTTNHLLFNDELVCSLLKVIEAEKPDVLYTHWVGDVHHDHQSLARACISSSRHIPRVLMYRSNFYDSADGFRGTVFVDISATFTKKFQAIECHESEMGRAGKKWVKYFMNQHQNDGTKIGVEYAEVFEPVKLLW